MDAISNIFNPSFHLSTNKQTNHTLLKIYKAPITAPKLFLKIPFRTSLTILTIFTTSSFRFFRPLLSRPPYKTIIGISITSSLFQPQKQATQSSSPFSSNSFVNFHKNSKMHHKVVIIGSGPAAHTAAVYLARAEMQPVLYEGWMANGIAPGGQLTTTTDVENYPGFPNGVMGYELMDKMREQSVRFGTKIITETVTQLDVSSRPFKFNVQGMEDKEPHTADAVILATGASARRMNLPNEDKYWQSGISACAVCDGAVPIFRNKHLIVIGGGDSAAEEAIFLTKYGSKVSVLVRRDKLRASHIMAKRLSSHPKVEILYNTVAIETYGDGKLLQGVKAKDTITGEEREIEANGLFYAIGHVPATTLVKGQIDLDSEGYVITQPGTSYTSVKGLFAAGDVQDKKYRQAITSAGSGCIAALECERLLAEEEDEAGTGPKTIPTIANKGDETNGA